MKNNLIEITRDKTNFFTSIFIYDNKKKVPKRIVEVEGKEIKLEYAFFFVLPIEEIDERMKQLKHETVKNSLFISGEEFCNRYFNSMQEKNHEKYAEFIAKMCDYDELIIKHAQFLKGKVNTIEVLKTILAIREDMQKTTAIFTSEENFGL